MLHLAPIVLFTYNRLFETRETINSLKKNFLSKESDLIIFSDGPKGSKDKKVSEVRDFLDTITGFKSVKIIKSSVNKGLANSIIDGVTMILKNYNSIIVLEDDLITSPNFLNFMNQALDFYEYNNQVFSISGYTMNLSNLKKINQDFYFGYRASSWGWGTWRGRWESVDWELKDFKVLSSREKCKFSKGGSDLPRMLNNHLNNKIDSWAIRWVYHQFITNRFSIFPSISKVNNIGYGASATHTKRITRFLTDLDLGDKEKFTFNNDVILNIKLLKEFRGKFSIFNRLLDRFYLLLKID
jgi:hypothetical protein